MANMITTALTWSQEDAAKYFLQPLFVSNNDLQHFDVMTNISGSSIKLDKYSALKDVTKAMGTACFEATETQSTNSNVTLTLCRLEVEHAQQGHALFNHIKSQLMKTGVSRNDLTGTMLMEMISKLLMDGIMRDFSTILWWGQTASGAGTQDFPIKGYPKKIEMDKYNAFILLTKDRFYENDKIIAEVCTYFLGKFQHFQKILRPLFLG